jgi:dsDNA-specific endonuclease/ATPase MutS2
MVKEKPMHAEQFNSVLQDSLSSMENYLKLLIDKDYTLSVIQNVKNYSLNLKNNLTEQYNNLSNDIQDNLKKKYKEIVKKFDKLTEKAIDQVKFNQEIISLSNDVFYNDAFYLNFESKN